MRNARKLLGMSVLFVLVFVMVLIEVSFGIHSKSSLPCLLHIKSIGQSEVLSNTAFQNALLQPSYPVKLPVWPVWSGIIGQILDWIGKPQLAEKLFSSVGGRVIPIVGSGANFPAGSPFLLLAHHRHSFTPFDPIRWLTSLALPEGFPAHSHSGFDTVTYCLKGGLLHRDSNGVKMEYGDGDIQWMRAGSGVIHEEMWNIKRKWPYYPIELFQIWVNLPTQRSSDPSFVKRIKCAKIPTIESVSKECNCNVRLVCGGYADNKSSQPLYGSTTELCASSVGMYDISVQRNQQESSENNLLRFEIANADSALLYVKAGKAIYYNDTNSIALNVQNMISAGNYLTITKHNESGNLSFAIGFEGDTLDALLLCGQHLNQPVYMEGDIVASSEHSLMLAKYIFKRLVKFSDYWDYKLDDNAWLEHIKQLNIPKLIQAAYKQYPSIEDSQAVK